VASYRGHCVSGSVFHLPARLWALRRHNGSTSWLTATPSLASILFPITRNIDGVAMEIGGQQVVNTSQTFTANSPIAVANAGVRVRDASSGDG
jgi:hypothetical protein